MFTHPISKLSWFPKKDSDMGGVLRDAEATEMTKQVLPTIEAEDSDPLYRATLAVEQDEQLATEMSEWEAVTIGDGIVCQPYGE